MTCDQCFGANGGDPVRTRDGNLCYVVTQDNQLQRSVCPGDPAPKKLPDGSDVPKEIADGVVNTFCAFIGADTPLEFLTWLACYMYASYEDGDLLQSEMVGITGTCGKVETKLSVLTFDCAAMCDSLLVGLCTCIQAGVCFGNIGGGGS